MRPIVCAWCGRAKVEVWKIARATIGGYLPFAQTGGQLNEKSSLSR